MANKIMSSVIGLVKFEHRACQVQAYGLANSCIGLVKFKLLQLPRLENREHLKVQESCRWHAKRLRNYEAVPA